MDSKKIINWIKENHLLIGVLIIALVIRLYLFIKIGDQVFFWDSAEYGNIARAWAFNIPYIFHPVRPVLLSFIWSLCLRIIPGSEFLPRMLILVLSMLSVYAMYLLGKEMFNEKVGLLAAFFMSINYLNLFYSFRILTDIPALAFFTLAMYFFYKYFKTNKAKCFYWAAAMTAIGALFKISIVAVLVIVLVYLLITERLRFLKKKEIWIGGIIFLLILSPYLIWGYMEFGGFVIKQAMDFHSPGEHELEISYLQLYFNNTKGYLEQLPSYFGGIILLGFIGGLVLMRRLLYGLDILFSKKEPESITKKELKRDLFLFLSFIIPFIIVVRSLVYVDMRIFIIVYPAILVIASYGIIKVYDFLKGGGSEETNENGTKEKESWKKILAIVFIIGILLMTGYGLKDTNILIMSKQNAYGEVKQAGLWLKQNTLSTEAIITTSVPQIRYYSERETFDFVETKEEFEQLIKDNPQIKYYILSVFEQHRDEPWMYSYPQENNLQILQIYQTPNGDSLLGIYRLK